MSHTFHYVPDEDEDYGELKRRLKGQALTYKLVRRRQQIEQEAAPKTAVTCPYCGATTTPDVNGCCEYCGGAVRG